MGKLSIRVDVDTIAKTIKVTDDGGNERDLKGITILGGDAESGQFYLFSEGASSDLGWALANGYKWSLMTDHPAGKHYQRMYHHFLKWIATFMGWSMGTQVTGTEVLERWDKEDLTRAVEESKGAKAH